MRQILTGVDLFNAVMMQHQVDGRLIALVEGPEDCGVLDPHLNDQEIYCYPGYGKSSVLKAAELLEGRSVQFVIPLIDADLDRFTGKDRAHPKTVVMTDFYDLDADLLFLCPGSLEALAANFSDRASRVTHLSTLGLNAFEVMYRMAVSVGVLRYCSIRMQLGVPMRDFPMKPVLEGLEAGDVHGAVLAQVVARSGGSPCSVTAAQMEVELDCILDGRHLISGHDLIASLATLANERWAVRVSRDTLARALRAAIGCACWRQTVFYRAVRDWAEARGVAAWTCAVVGESA